MQEKGTQLKLVVALRAARAAVGWSQEEFAKLMGVSKSTVARWETNEADISFADVMQIIDLYGKNGVSIDVMKSIGVEIYIEGRTIEAYGKRLEDDLNRRSDRRKKKQPDN
jgi:transcriptional regulator with XRE-family HTH domain